MTRDFSVLFDGLVQLNYASSKIGYGCGYKIFSCGAMVNGEDNPIYRTLSNNSFKKQKIDWTKFSNDTWAFLNKN